MDKLQHNSSVHVLLVNIFLRRDGLRSSVSYHSFMETTNQFCLQQIALFLIKAGEMRQISD